MGAVISVLDSCGSAAPMSTPSDYIEYELARQQRIETMQKKKRLDIMGTAMQYAVADFKALVGYKEYNSDDEDTADRDGDEKFQDMSMLKRKYLKRKDSDQSINSQYRKRGEDLYQVSASL